MEFSKSDFVSVEEILADVLKIVNDSDFKVNSKGWYTSQIQQALEELSFDTFFLKITNTLEIPHDLRLEMPKGAFNLCEIYVHNGNQCNFGTAQVVYHKRNFINSKSGNDYVARDMYGNSNDPFHTKRSFTKNMPDNVYFYGVQQGLIMLSPNTRNFSHITLVYNGVHTDIGEVPVVPTYLRQAVKDYVSVEALTVRVAEEESALVSKWLKLLDIHTSSLNHPYDGSWVKAERRVKGLDNKQRQDIKEYFSRMNY
jgi:hypothetical protein